jgi:hypothetical protein
MELQMESCKAAAEIGRARGLRRLARLTRLGLELCFAHTDTDLPIFLHAWNATTKAGSDNPHNHDLNATVRGDCEYRLRGSYWLPLATDSSLLTVLQNLSDRRRESPATVTIERIGGPSIYHRFRVFADPDGLHARGLPSPDPGHLRAPEGRGGLLSADSIE